MLISLLTPVEPFLITLGCQHDLMQQLPMFLLCILCLKGLVNPKMKIVIYSPLCCSKPVGFVYLQNTNEVLCLCKKKKEYIYIYIQCPPLILAPLINVRKGVCENKSALFILLIFHSKNSQNSNLSLK